MPSDAHELAAQLLMRCDVDHPQPCACRYRAAAAELERLADENARLREALLLVRRSGGTDLLSWQEIDALLASSGPPQETTDTGGDRPSLSAVWEVSKDGFIY